MVSLQSGMTRNFRVDSISFAIFADFFFSYPAATRVIRPSWILRKKGGA